MSEFILTDQPVIIKRNDLAPVMAWAGMLPQCCPGVRPVQDFWFKEIYSAK